MDRQLIPDVQTQWMKKILKWLLRFFSMVPDLVVEEIGVIEKV